MVETFFSECGGSCIGFTEGSNKKIVPLFESEWYPQSMFADISLVQNVALRDVNEVCRTFSDLISLLELSPLDSIMDLMQLYFADYNNASTIFKNIRFKETYSHLISKESLASMMIRKNRT